MATFDIIPATEEWKRLACETGALLKDPQPIHQAGKPDLLVYPLPEAGRELARNFHSTMVENVKKLLASRKRASPAPPKKESVVIDIGLDGISTRTHQFMMLAILPNVDASHNVNLWIGHNKARINDCTNVSLAPGDHVIVYEDTKVMGNLGSRCIITLIDTLPM
ncbi:uncharacterized protein PV09_08045 [Verruconis gallopava]|uniref:Uncharacterized protein n=1 Tax=Verruconis gallopava TaxID=253628 RepID=A0A0D1YHK2_9PEZI|nr:uncharacterized protein PV09_08045 [Verruconis gallopava]KIW00332.1 hypothetical protein PV09_08045 [Verruconis gallopava]